ARLPQPADCQQQIESRKTRSRALARRTKAALVWAVCQNGPPMRADLKQLVLAEARAAGFDAARVTTPAAAGATMAARLTAFLREGRHGDMAWMETTAERRGHPNAMWAEARSIVMLGMSYAPDSDPLAVLAEPDRGAISCYAQCSDYHDVVKAGLKRV